MARPKGRMELYGYGLPLWYKILPPYDHDRWNVNNRVVADCRPKTAGAVIEAARDQRTARHGRPGRHRGPLCE